MSVASCLYPVPTFGYSEGQHNVGLKAKTNELQPLISTLGETLFDWEVSPNPVHAKGVGQEQGQKTESPKLCAETSGHKALPYKV